MGGQHVMALSENVVFWQSELGQMLMNHESLGRSSFHQIVSMIRPAVLPS